MKNLLNLIQKSLENGIRAGAITPEEIEAAFPENGSVYEIAQLIVDKLNGNGERVYIRSGGVEDYHYDCVWMENFLRDYHAYDEYLFAKENPCRIQRTKTCRREPIHRISLGRRMTVEQVKHLFEKRGLSFSGPLELLAKGPEWSGGKRTYTLNGMRPVEGKPETYLCLCVWRNDKANFAKYEEIGPEGFPANALFQGFFWDPLA